MIYYDMHCHLDEFADNEIESILNSQRDLKIVAVSEDMKSLTRILDIADRFGDRVIPCAGFHPWSLKDHDVAEAYDIIKVAESVGVRCVGEVGLDKRFMPVETFNKQYEVFLMYINLAKELDALINIHAPDAWREALAALVDNDVAKAMFHWYSGPLDLIDDIVGRGYAVSINVALSIQPKLTKVVAVTPTSGIVFESDGPYVYHGVRLSPLMIPELAKKVAEIKGLEVDKLVELVKSNSERLLGT